MKGEVIPIPPEPLRLHRRVHAELVARHNEGFREGVCHALDELAAAGFHEAYQAMLARLFSPPPSGPGQPDGAPSRLPARDERRALAAAGGTGEGAAR